MASRARWIVVCDQYTTEPFASQSAAERKLAQVEQSGHCQEAHRIEKVGAYGYMESNHRSTDA